MAQTKFSNFQIKKPSVLYNHIPSLSGEYEFRHPFLLPLRYVSDDDLKLAVVPLQYSGLVKTSNPGIFDQTLKKLFTLTKKGDFKTLKYQSPMPSKPIHDPQFSRPL